ncbi:hypothetical protein U1Q18_035613, partial [Sarracenia purpurea var. burkii]
GKRVVFDCVKWWFSSQGEKENSGFKVVADELGCAGDENGQRKSRHSGEHEAKSDGAHCVLHKEDQRNQAAICGY